MPEILSFELERKQKLVRLNDPKTKSAKWYLLIEMTGTLRDEYLNTMRPKLDQTSKSARLTDFTGVQANLLAKSLFPCTVRDFKRSPTAEEIETGKVKAADCDSEGYVTDYEADEVSKDPVTVEWLQALPASVQSALAKHARDMSGMGDDAEKEAKND